MLYIAGSGGDLYSCLMLLHGMGLLYLESNVFINAFFFFSTGLSLWIKGFPVNHTVC